MSAQDEICSDVYLTNDQTLVEIYATTTLDFCSDMCQIRVEIVQIKIKSARKMSMLFHALQMNACIDTPMRGVPCGQTMYYNTQNEIIHTPQSWLEVGTGTVEIITQYK